MKAAKHILTASLAIAAMLFCACNKVEVPTPEPEFELSINYHLIAVSIMDSAGKDLLVPFWEEQWMPERDLTYTGTINPERYELEIESPGYPSWKRWSMEERKLLIGPHFNVCNFYDSSQYFHEQYGETYDMYVLTNCLDWGKGIRPEDVLTLARELTYRITCPTVFGDYKSHELVTYWEESEDRLTATAALPRCTRAIYDGKEIQVEKITQVWSENSSWNYLWEQFYLMRIVLDE